MRSSLRMSMCYKRGGCPVVPSCDILAAVEELKMRLGYTVCILGDGYITDDSCQIPRYDLTRSQTTSKFLEAPRLLLITGGESQRRADDLLYKADVLCEVP
ncbi:hypothetical protein Pmar_PMAR001304 [Perkinsus marinus ATCC 50983]|uniref:Uncharacterized protein n=1 Tax=Perkinsus marinus (strain ATCC 50983 / TXsc) TaxID=423536 RepID=C5K694_PERM5|nr:hypothetical protein Pmar_PMAR001304 [Perkinsus marinus ATCC 50983]EER20000.1 hypothetical protein Pmar_PMAR001304 [Perkinsus marinus ATCC 50983]|eukprot:XP_002788204.1 hypothetical protein Pmar_PMAR001304 [Perkinsus marinus ATCC 50983]